jgi:hypothetical protein
MALIQYSALVNDIRGSVGNATFQRNGSLHIVRSKPAPIERYSQQAINVRNATAQAAFAWRTLSSAQQLQYKNFISYSPEFMRRSPKSLISGYELFVKYNTLRLLRGHTILTDISYGTPSAFPWTAYINSSGTNLYYYSNIALDPAIWWLQIQLSRSKGIAQSRVLGSLRIIDHADTIALGFPITTGYTAAYGYVPPSGDFITCRVTFFHATMPYIYSPVSSLHQIQVH